MILINFAHPLTDEQKEKIEKLAEKKVKRIIALPVQFDPGYPFRPQLDALMEKVTLSSEEWQTEPIIVNLPSLNHISALLLAEMHGRMGYFPPIVRIRPKADTTPVQYEVAEILDLRNVRDAAREDRK